MKKIFFTVFVLISVLVISCQQSTKTVIIPANKISVDMNMIDSIKAKADSIYTKKYPRTDFVTAEYFVNHSDSSITQVMKDAAGTIRQVIIEKNKTRIYTAKFYANGQLNAKYNLDNFGQYNDSSKEFYENGHLKTEGIYNSGLHAGKWKNYDSTGKYLNTVEYNKDGQELKTTN